MSNDLSRRVLLAALAPDPAPFVSVVAQSTQHIDWAWMWERAVAHKVASLLAARVEAAGFTAQLPESVRKSLLAIGADAERRNEAAQRTIALLAERVGQSDLPFLIMKGCVLVEQVYRDPGMRRFHDVDIVVHPDHVAAAELRLRVLGFGLNGIGKLLGVELRAGTDTELAEAVAHQSFPYFHYQLELVPRVDRTLLPVDLHWHVAPPARLRIRAEELWPYTLPVKVAGQSVLGFEPAAMVVHLAVHALSSWPQSFRLLHLCDLAWALARLDFSPQRLWHVADAWGAEADLAAALHAVENILAVPLPASLRSDEAPPVRRRFTRLITATELVDRCATPAPAGWERRLRELKWGLAMGTLRGNLKWALRIRRLRLEFERQRRQSTELGCA